MNPNQIVSETKTKLDHALDHFKEELKKLRTGRAHPGMLDNIDQLAAAKEKELMTI
jgi:ribosome recycling factor